MAEEEGQKGENCEINIVYLLTLKYIKDFQGPSTFTDYFVFYIFMV